MFRPDCLVVVSAGIPLALAVRANLTTSLFHAAAWAVVAWAAWIIACVSDGFVPTFVALVLTGCAGIAVLGARKPGAVAWNFVVGGLLIVLLLPVAEAHVLGTPLRLGAVRTVFLGSLLGVTVINYLPTALGPGALVLGVGCGLALARADGLSMWLLGTAPWLAWLGLFAMGKPRSAAAGLWRAVRDRYGFVWGQRVREQFNRAAANARLPVELRWTGPKPDDPDPAAYDLLAAVTTRFGLR